MFNHIRGCEIKIKNIRFVTLPYEISIITLAGIVIFKNIASPILIRTISPGCGKDTFGYYV